MIRRRKLLEIAADSPASGARFVRRWMNARLAGLKNERSEITKRRETNDSVLVERSFYTRQVHFEAPYLQVMSE